MISLNQDRHNFVVVQHDFSSLLLNSAEDIELGHDSSSEGEDFTLGYGILPAPETPPRGKLIEEGDLHQTHHIVGWFGPSKQKQLEALRHCIDMLSRRERPVITSATGRPMQL
uniref:Uncharacterized protein n=1 Tax=Guillardia theta TaxID=55529 RepID=A0A7S4JKD5_GUITH|mmetsp:Transcript_17140/g.56798  ORF Transcript_17140/g.56798 Transcript_17140/m.56798 type:complete len:113 (+) Transcript_17140:164-502(+)